MLDQPITVLSGVGEKRAKDLAALGIQTIEDLLRYYPFRYEDIQERQLNEIQDQEKSHDQRNRCFPGCCKSFWLQKESAAVSNDARS